MKAIFLEVYFFDVLVSNKMKLMRYKFILKNFINCTDECRTASIVNRYTRNKYVFHTEPNTFFLNICNTFGCKIFIGLCFKNVICPLYFDAYFI